MDIKIVPLSHFERELKRLAKKYKTLLPDIYILRDNLKENPKNGTSLGSNLYKIRLGTDSKGGGKSGGFRVVTYYVQKTSDGEIVYLVTIFDKSEEANISKERLLKIVSEALR